MEIKSLHSDYGLIGTDSRKLMIVVDKIEFELPFGLLGKLLEFYIELKLLKIFKHRELATKKFLE